MTDTGRPLEAWLASQRWFHGKDRAIVRADVIDGADLASHARWQLVEVTFGNHPADRYQLVLVPAGGQAPPGGLVTVDGRVWADAAVSPAVLGQLARLAAAGGAIATAAGATIDGAPCAGGRIPDDARALGVEQSNTSVVFGDTAVLKLFRRIEPGPNPDIELTAALTTAGSRDVPRQLGALVLRGDGRSAPLGVVNGFVAGAEDGWRLAVDDAAATVDLPRDGRRRAFLTRLADLGRATARVHTDLAGALGDRPATDHDLSAWVAHVHAQVDEVLGDRPLPTIAAAALHAAIDDLAEQIDDPGRVSRIHGDLHLGQVLLGDHGWQVLDFEGEPATPAEQRRAPGSPARDIAGMLRSFDYAAATAHREASATWSEAVTDVRVRRDDLPRPLTDWRDAARGHYVRGYEAVADAPVVPALVALFELHKAVYEIAYERSFRPDWVTIPVGGVQRVLDRVQLINAE